jgi:ligand-binding SRPBCC domain-containing protein
MPLIELITDINAPVERCFDLARSIDLHKISLHDTGEEAVAGVTSGLIGKGQQVTWRARHFGISQRLTSRITQFTHPYHFRDEMVDGVFRTITHDHLFQESGGKTIMKDNFYFESPGWILGKLFNKIILTGYLRGLLRKRNALIKQVAESASWKTILNT